MMEMIKSYLGAFAAVSLVLATGAASAAPIQGDVTFSGAWEGRAADTTSTVAIEAAVHIAFLNPVTVSQAIGDFEGAAGAAATYTSFTFDPFIGPIAPLWTFEAGGITFSFNLKDITLGMQTESQLTLTGTGTVKAAGFDNTAFNWTFSGDSTTAFLSFSSSAFSAYSVPEPSAIGLLGLGLLAMGAVGVRRRSAARKA
jgi:hypothetical protein